ncbi:MAG: hypothetical protein ACRC2T_01260 [Thermoguttaceae bacterium]
MKKTLMFIIFTVTLSSLAVGCSTTSDWCRRGSVWPFSKPAPTVDDSFQMSYGMAMSDPCCPTMSCDPCTPTENCNGPSGSFYPTPN